MAARRTRRVALVTGGGGALGAAICAALARSDHAVAVCDVDARAGRRVARALGRGASAVAADVGRPAEVARLFAALSRSPGAPDVLVHCAGTPGRFAPLSALRDADWRAAMRAHLDGAFYCLRAAAPAMIARGFGRIVLISSLAGLRGTVASGAYAAAKAGLAGLAQTAAKELGPFAITVNAVAPGMVATPPNEALLARASGFITRALAQTPTRALSRPEDIAQLVVFLAGDAARNVNGQVIAHDGGAGISLSSDEYMRERFLPARSRQT